MADLPAYLAPTFAERKAARERDEKRAPAEAEAKQVDEAAETVEDKAVSGASTKRRAAKKS